MGDDEVEALNKITGVPDHSHPLGAGCVQSHPEIQSPLSPVLLSCVLAPPPPIDLIFCFLFVLPCGCHFILREKKCARAPCGS